MAPTDEDKDLHPRVDRFQGIFRPQETYPRPRSALRSGAQGTGASGDGAGSLAKSDGSRSLRPGGPARSIDTVDKDSSH